MFLQIMYGKVADEGLLRKQMDVWRQEFKNDAVGYLGSTSGFTDDGHFVALARFESADAARANSSRPEQGEWWEAMASAFEGDVEFTDCEEVDLIHEGGSDDAGFVQIMKGRAVDPEKLRSAADAMETDMTEARPDVVGVVVGWHGDREFTQAVYFSSEEEARKAEAVEGDSDDAADDAWRALIDGELAFIDLHEPMFD